MGETVIDRNTLSDGLIYEGHVVGVELMSPRELLQLQLAKSVDAMRRLDDGNDLSPLYDLNPICELTDALETSGADFVEELRECKFVYKHVLDAIAGRAQGASQGDGRAERYKDILVAMGWDTQVSAPATPAKEIAHPPETTSTPIDKIEDKPLAKVIPLQSPAPSAVAEPVPKPNRGIQRRKLTSMAALAGITLAGTTGIAIAAPASPSVPEAAAHVSSITFQKQGESSAGRADLANPDGSKTAPAKTIQSASSQPSPNLVPSITVPGGQSHSPEQTPGAGSVPVGGSTTPPEQGGAPVTVSTGNGSETDPSSPGAPITVGGSTHTSDPGSGTPTGGSSESPPPASGDPVTDGPPSIVVGGSKGAASSGHPITVAPPVSVSGGAHSGKSTPSPPPSSGGGSITVSGNSNPGTPKLHIRPPAGGAEQSDKDELNFLMQNGTSTNVIQQYTQMLATEYSLTPVAPANPFLQAVNQFIGRLDAKAGTNQADMNAVLAGTLAQLPAAEDKLDLSALADSQDTFVSYTSQHLFGDRETGLAALDDQGAYADATIKPAIYTLLAKALEDDTTATEQQQILKQLGYVAPTPEPSPPSDPHPHPTPPRTPVRPEPPKHNYGGGSEHDHGAPQPPERPDILDLTPEEMQLQAAQAIAEWGGTWENQGIVQQYYLQKAQSMGWSPAVAAAFASGMVGNCRVESGCNPQRVQAGYAGGPYSSTIPDSVKGGAGGYGLLQWTSEGRQDGLQEFSDNDPQHRPVDDLSLQLDYSWHELTHGYSFVLVELRNVTSAREAASIIMRDYEVPGTPLEAERRSGAADMHARFSSQMEKLWNQRHAARTRYHQEMQHYHQEMRAYHKAQRERAKHKAAEKEQIQFGKDILASIKLLDPYGYNNGDGSHGGYRHTDYRQLWWQIEHHEIAPGSLILDCSAAVNAAIWRASHGKIDLGTDATFDYQNDPHFKPIDPTQARPGDVIVWYFGPNDGHTEVVDHYSNGVWHTFGSHWYYDDVRNDIGPSAYTAHGGEYGILNGHAKVYRIVQNP